MAARPGHSWAWTISTSCSCAGVEAGHKPGQRPIKANVCRRSARHRRNAGACQRSFGVAQLASCILQLAACRSKLFSPYSSHAMSALPPAIFLMGPTAAGKTDLALELAQALPCELISVDSALIYRGMDIGTAKPSPELLAQFPHRLIDIRDPAESYSAAEFRADALAAMAEITARGRIP